MASMATNLPPLTRKAPNGYANGHSNGHIQLVKSRDAACVTPSAQYDTPEGLNGSETINRRKQESLIESLRNGIVNHQLGVAVNICLLIALTHLCFPRARPLTRAFFQLSYHDTSTGKFNQGIQDFCFVFCWIIIFTGLRAAIMDYIFLPLAQHWGLDKLKTRIRFAEQGWSLTYALASWTLGMYLMGQGNYWFNLREMWTNFPTRGMDGLMKWYYLVQLSFWTQQLIVVNIEEHRKDFSQMFTHHIITCLLILLSYGFYQTKVGNVILCAMDIADILLPFAKILKYLEFQTACDCAFAAFIIVWIVARHIFYSMICWSSYWDMKAEMAYACYNSVSGEIISDDGGSNIWSNVLQPFLDPEGTVCFNAPTQFTFIGLLTFLHVLILAWLVMILRIAWKVIRGQGADDQRSDVSDADDVAKLSDLEDDEEVTIIDPAMAEIELAPLEEEVGVEDLNLRSRAGSPRYRKSGSSTGTLSDKKELLGRIGCEKPID